MLKVTETVDVRAMCVPANIVFNTGRDNDQERSLTLSPLGFKYKDQLIDDAGDAYILFTGWFKGENQRWSKLLAERDKYANEVMEIGTNHLRMIQAYNKVAAENSALVGILYKHGLADEAEKVLERGKA